MPAFPSASSSIGPAPQTYLASKTGAEDLRSSRLPDAGPSEEAEYMMYDDQKHMKVDVNIQFFDLSSPIYFTDKTKLTCLTAT